MRVRAEGAVEGLVRSVDGSLGTRVRRSRLGTGLDGSGAGVRDDGEAEGLLTRGGAIGTVGEEGVSEAVRRRGRITRAATPHVSAAPAAARRRRRRDAPRRIAS
ncbi:hypothetical protein ABZZ74_29150 [Streptomyces sp. NPDC006476]|uniref:hypothetical protein n=1 Tax=Streptomyces sp. NPDC006476 TaxID=3157175 RepID=UPI0033B5DAB2